jgi:predicted DCC family thiol-disulfide oxidoreductase YuxK
MSAATPGTRLRPTGLTVLYDAHCPVCRRARRWVERHRLLLPVRFVPAGSELARQRFPELDVGSTLADVTVITDQGAVLRGDRAWVAVLWSVAITRTFAIRLTQGRGTRRLRSVKGATEAIRRYAGTERDPGIDTTRNPADARTWPPPHAAGQVGADDDVCAGCRT